MSTPTSKEMMVVTAAIALAIGGTVLSLNPGYIPLSPAAIQENGQTIDELKAAVVAIDIVVDGTPMKGTGMLLTEDGWVLTNHHVASVIPDPQAVSVLVGGKTFQGQVRFSGKTICSTASGCKGDIALIKLEGATGLSFVEISEEPGKAGDRVVALGYVAGASRLMRSDSTLEGLFKDGTYKTPERFLSPGNSGGPIGKEVDSGGLLDQPRYEIIGMAAAMDERTGVGKSLPFETIVQVLADNQSNIKK